MAYLDGYTATNVFDDGWNYKKAQIKQFVVRGLTEEEAFDLINIHYPKSPPKWFLVPVILDREPKLFGTELYWAVKDLFDNKLIPYPYGNWNWK